jgi:hypothetical protein
MSSIKLSIAGLAVLATLTGCGGGAELTPQQMQKVSQFDMSKIGAFSQKLNKGMNDDELIFYAPYSIDLAKEYYQDALEAEKKDEKIAAYLQAKQALQNAYETKKMVKKYLADVADIKRRMQTQNTKEIYAGRYEDFLDDYNDLITLIDKRKTPEALEDKKTVMQEAKDLYGDAVVYRNINKAKIILDNMADDDLDELAPQHFEKAQKLYESARLRIKKEPDNKEMVKRVSKQINEAAQYAQTLAKDVFYFKELNEDELEGYFAKLHRHLAELNPKEKTNAILPLPIYAKIEYLQELEKSLEHTAQKIPAVKIKEDKSAEKVLPLATKDIEVKEDVIVDNNTTVIKKSQKDELITPEKAIEQESKEAIVVPAAVTQKSKLEAQETESKTVEQESVSPQEKSTDNTVEAKQVLKETEEPVSESAAQQAAASSIESTETTK